MDKTSRFFRGGWFQKALYHYRLSKFFAPSGTGSDAYRPKLSPPDNSNIWPVI